MNEAGERHPPANPGPLLRTLCVCRGPVREGLACQSVAGQPVEVNTQFILVESFEDDRLVESVRVIQRIFIL